MFHCRVAIVAAVTSFHSFDSTIVDNKQLIFVVGNYMYLPFIAVSENKVFFYHLADYCQWPMIEVLLILQVFKHFL